MAEHTNEDGELLYISCDAEGGCDQYIGKRDVAFGYTPGPHTGWTATGEGTERRYYCETHAGEAR